LAPETHLKRTADLVNAPGSWILHGVDRLAARPWIAGSVVAVDTVWVTFSIVQEFPSRLETIFQTLVAALTMAMVFVIQHTQAKLSMATQRKLDEILRALPGANDALIRLEQAPIGDIQAATEVHLLAKDAAVSARDR
jgi:low affinity Fe/Cu permease